MCPNLSSLFSHSFNVLSSCIQGISSIVISNLTTSSLESAKSNTTSTLLISASPSASVTPRLESTSLTVMAKIWPAQPDTPQLTPIWALSRAEETTLSRLASSSCTLIKAVYHGRASQPVPRRKSMRKSVTRSFPHQLRPLQRTYQMSSAFILTTAAVSNSRRSLILVTWENYSRTYSIAWATSTISSSIGWWRNQAHSRRCAVQRPNRTIRTLMRAVLPSKQQAWAPQALIQCKWPETSLLALLWVWEPLKVTPISRLRRHSEESGALAAEGAQLLAKCA